MNPRLMVFAFLIVCFTRLAVGQGPTPHPVPQQEVDSITRANRQHPKTLDQSLERPSRQVVDQEWLSKQSNALLDIIKMLYNDREAEVKNLEAAQEKMKPDEQIERRIAFIKATLSEKGAKAGPAESPAAPVQ